MTSAVLTRLLERAALDGSTCVPAQVVAAALRGVGGTDPDRAVAAAVEAGTICSYPDERLVGHARHAADEDRLARRLVRLVAADHDHGLVVVDAPRGTDAAAVLDPLTASVEARGGRVVRRADRLGLAEAVALTEALPDGASLVLVGDPALPPGAAPGQVLVDVVGSGAVPVRTAPLVDGGPDPLGVLVQSLRTGVLPAVDPRQRQLVVTPAADPDEAVRRAVQLVTESVPRVFEVSAADVLVLAPRTEGRTGVDALSRALAEAGQNGVEVVTCRAAAGRSAAAIVLVLGAEGAGSLTRDVLVGAATEAQRHLLVVHQAGPALAGAVARRPHRFRRTRLAALLAAGLG